MHALKKLDPGIAVLIATGSTYFLLFYFRGLDDNATASWEWVFSVVNATGVYGPLVLALVLAYGASRVALPRRFTPLLLFFASFTVSSLFWSIPEFNIDAARYFTQAKHLELYGVSHFFREWGKSITAWSDLPAVPLLYGVTFKLFGEYRLAVQLATTTLFSLTVLLTYETGVMLWEEETAVYAAALLLAIPYLSIQVPLMLVDVPTMFFLMLSVVSFIRALERGGVWMSLISPLAACLTFFSKYSAWPMLSVLGVVFLVLAGKDRALRSKIFRRGMVSALIALFLVGTVLILKWDVVSGQIRLLMGFQGPGLKRWGESFISTFLFQMHPLVSAAALFSVYPAWKKRDYTYAIIAWLPALALLFRVERIRYLLPVFPMITLMAARGLQAISRKRTALCIVYSAVFTSFVISLFAYAPYLKKQGAQNLMDAGRFLDGTGAREAEVFVLPQKGEEINPAVTVPLLDLATSVPIIYREEQLAPAGDISESRYRFTWEFKNPAYYNNEASAARDRAVVVISGRPGEALPERLNERVQAYQRCRVFDKRVNLFSFQTAVRVYWQKAGGS